MAKFVLKQASVVVNSVDLSDHVDQVTINIKYNSVDATVMSTSGFTQALQGMGDASVTVDFFQDFAAGNVDATLWPLASAGTTFTISIKPTQAAVSATNPRYDMTAMILSYAPVDGKVGDASKTSVDFSNASTAGLTRN